jgi:small-conductance mechanosensitive channel
MLALKYIREITIAALTIAVIALIGLYGQSRADIEHLKTERALQLTTAKAAYEVQARKLEQQQYDQTITAINDHKKCEAANASAIASANTANERLSQTIDRLAANAETDAAYRTQYAATTGQLLKECSGSITRLAKAADGHVNDIRLLQDAR